MKTRLEQFDWEQLSRRIKNARRWLSKGMLALFGLFVAYMIFAPFTFSVSRTYVAQAAHMAQPGQATDIVVQLTGRYSLCFFRGRMFEGYLSIEGYAVTAHPTRFRAGGVPTVLRYEQMTAQGPRAVLMGEITTDFWLRNLDIVVYNFPVEGEYRRGYIDMQGDNNVFIAASTNRILDLPTRYARMMYTLRGAGEAY